MRSAADVRDAPLTEAWVRRLEKLRRIVKPMGFALRAEAPGPKTIQPLFTFRDIAFVPNDLHEVDGIVEVVSIG